MNRCRVNIKVIHFIIVIVITLRYKMGENTNALSVDHRAILHDEYHIEHRSGDYHLSILIVISVVTFDLTNNKLQISRNFSSVILLNATSECYITSCILYEINSHYSIIKTSNEGRKGRCHIHMRVYMCYVSHTHE